MVGRALSSVVGAAARRPVAVLAITTVLVLAGAALALRLTPSAGTNTLVGRGTAEFKATDRYHQQFGDDAVIVLVRGPLTKLVLTSDIERVLGLEGCIGGNVPSGVTPRGGRNGPCAQLARTHPVKIVFGPGTFINESVGQIDDEFVRQQAQAKQDADKVATAARKLALGRGMSRTQADVLASQARQLRQAQFARDVIQLALKYGLTSAPKLNDPNFVARLVFSDGSRPGTPKARFAYLFPTRDSALIQVRLKPDLSDHERTAAIRLIRRAVAMPDWRLRNGGSFVVTGAPVVVSDLTGRISHSIVLLLIAALLVMAATLGIVFRRTPRLLPLLIAMAAAALTFGGLSLAGASLTMASIAVLPVLIGLAVDYAIQFQSRVAEAGGDLRRAAALGGPTLLTAGAATAAGFLVLVLSPVPMVRGFGVLLVIGIVVAFATTFTAGAAILAVWRGWPGGGEARGGEAPPGPGRAGGPGLGAAGGGRGRARGGNPPAGAGRRRAPPPG